jgi:hypothetical protein
MSLAGAVSTAPNFFMADAALENLGALDHKKIGFLRRDKGGSAPFGIPWDVLTYNRFWELLGFFRRILCPADLWSEDKRRKF